MKKHIVAVLIATSIAVAWATETTPEAAAFFNKGVEKTNAGDYAAAVEAFEKSLALDPDLIEAHEWIAHILILKGDNEGAIERYKKIVARRPSTESRVSLGLAYLRVGQVDAAVETLAGAVAADPGNFTGWNNLSMAYLRQGKVPEARAAAEKALALKGDYAAAYVNLGNAQLRGGDEESAIASFEKAVGLDKNQADAYYGLAEARSFAGDDDAAGDYYIEYLERGGKDDVRHASAVKWLWEHGRGAEVPK